MSEIKDQQQLQEPELKPTSSPETENGQPADRSIPLNFEDQAKAVLERNDRGTYTIPAEGLYPHQWLWDSCFIAIGLRHVDVERAKMEILSLFRAQWTNGMVPHMIFTAGESQHRLDYGMWQSWVSPFAPDGMSTSGITQPPMLAEAVVQIGK